MSFWIWFWALAALVFLLLRRSNLATEVSQTHRWLIQAGYRDAFRVKYYFGARILLAAAGFAGVVLFSGFDNPFLLACVPGLGMKHCAIYQNELALMTSKGWWMPWFRLVRLES